jgi:hypothetical protein
MLTHDFITVQQNHLLPTVDGRIMEVPKNGEEKHVCSSMKYRLP